MSEVVLDVLHGVIDRIEIDAYSDHADAFGPDELQAQDDLRALGISGPRPMADPFMAVELRMDDATHRDLARTYQSWSINADSWSDALSREVVTFHDSSWSITMRLTDEEAARIAVLLTDVGRLELLRDLDRERRTRFRAAAARSIRRLLGRQTTSWY